MTSLISIIISLIVLLLIIFIKDVRGLRRYNLYHDTLHYKIKNYTRFLIITSIIVFIIVTIIDICTNKYDSSWLSFITIVLNALSIAIITMPISISEIYGLCAIDEKLLYAKYVVTDIFDTKIMKKFNKAGILLVILTKKRVGNKIKTVTEEEYNRRFLNNNLVIKTNDQTIVKKLNNAVFEFDDLEAVYKRIELTRHRVDNVARILKYNFLMYLPLLLLYFDIAITGFPLYYNVLTILVLKLMTVLVTEFIYFRMEKDVDIMARKPLKEGTFIVGKQETMFMVFSSICALFCYALPYQYIMYEGGTFALAITLILSTFIFHNIFVTYSLYSESPLVVNFIKSIKNIEMMIYLLLCIIFSILINYIYILDTKKLGLHNYFLSIFFAFLPVLLLEIIKLARYTSTKGVKKSETKNNQKRRRS